MLKQILNSINFYFLKLQQQFDELETYSFITKDYSILISKLRNIYEKMYLTFLETNKRICKEVDDSNNLFDINLYNSYYEKDIKIFFQYFNIFNSFFELLKKSNNNYIDQGIFILIDKFIKTISADVKFIIIPGFEFNYGYLDMSSELNRFRSYLDLEEEKRNSFLLFSLPYFKSKDIFSSALLGHEIGHYLEEIYNIYEDQIKPILFSEKLVSLEKIHHIVDDRFEEIKKDQKYQDLDHSLVRYNVENECLEELYEKTEMWVKEIICDKIALKIFGFSYFFAFIDLIFLTDPKSLGDEEHPPNWLRLKYQIIDLKKESTWNVLENGLIIEEIDGRKPKKNNIGEKIIEIIEYLENNFTEEELLDEDPIYEVILKDIIRPEILGETIDNSLKPLVKNKVIKDFSYKDNIEEIFSLIKLLREYITPNEIIDSKEHRSNPADIINILNAGWIFLLFQINYHFKIFNLEENDYSIDDRIQLKKMEIYQKLSNLTLKAIELSNIHEKFKKTQNDVK